MGGREDAEQLVDLALVRAVGKFNTARPESTPVVEIWADVLHALDARPNHNRGAGPIARMARSARAEVALEEDTRSEEAAQERAALDADAHRKMRQALDQAVKDGILTAEIARAVALKHLDRQNSREVAAALGIVGERDYQALRRQMQLALKRLGGGAKQKAHGKKPRG